jgi:hypothetical protein
MFRAAIVRLETLCTVTSDPRTHRELARHAVTIQLIAVEGLAKRYPPRAVSEQMPVDSGLPGNAIVIEDHRESPVRKEERKKGRKEGRKEGVREGRREGRKEGRND